MSEDGDPRALRKQPVLADIGVSARGHVMVRLRTVVLLLVLVGVLSLVWGVRAITAPDRLLRRIRAGPMVQDLAFSPDGRLATYGVELVAASGFQESVSVWDVTTGERIRRVPHPGRLGGFSRDGRHLLLITAAGVLELWDTRTWRAVPVHRAHERDRFSISAALSPDGSLMAVKEDASSLVVRRVGTRIPVSRIDPASEVIRFSPDGGVVAYALQSWGAGGGVYLADVKTGRTIHYFPANCVAFTPDGRRVAAGDGEGGISLWEVSTWRRIRRIPDRDPRAWFLDFSPGGQMLAAAGGESARLLDVSTGLELMRLSVGAICGKAVFSPDGTRLAVNIRREVQVWQVRPRSELVLRARLRRLLH